MYASVDQVLARMFNTISIENACQLASGLTYVHAGAIACAQAMTQQSKSQRAGYLEQMRRQHGTWSPDLCINALVQICGKSWLYCGNYCNPWLSCGSYCNPWLSCGSYWQLLQTLAALQTRRIQYKLCLPPSCMHYALSRYTIPCCNAQ